MEPNAQTQPSIIAISGTGSLYTTSFIPKFIDKSAATFALLSNGLVNIYKSDGTVAMQVRPSEIISRLHGATLNNKVDLNIQGVDYIFRVDASATSPITNTAGAAGGIIALNNAMGDTNSFFEHIAQIQNNTGAPQEVPQVPSQHQQFGVVPPALQDTPTPQLQANYPPETQAQPQQYGTVVPTYATAPPTQHATFPPTPNVASPSIDNSQIKNTLNKRARSNGISGGLMLFFGVSGLLFASPETPTASRMVTYVLLIGGIVLIIRSFTAYSRAK